VLALKGNQGTLHRDIELFFQEQVARDFADARFDHHASVDADHGRIEERDCWVTDDIDWLKDLHDGLAGLAVHRHDPRPAHPQRRDQQRSPLLHLLARSRRSPVGRSRPRPLGIENRLHWVLDMTFREDESRIRKDNAPHNAGILKHMALNMLKKTPVRKSIRLKRKSAGWDNQFLQAVLMAA